MEVLVIRSPSQLRKHILYSTLWCSHHSLWASAKCFYVFSSFLAPPKEGHGTLEQVGWVGVRWGGEWVVTLLLALAVPVSATQQWRSLQQQELVRFPRLPPRISLVGHWEVSPQMFSRKCPPPRLPHSLDVLLQMSPLRHPSFRCPPSDIFLQMSLPQNSSLRGLSADVPPLRHPSFSCPSLKCPPPEVLPQRSPLRPLPSDVFPTDSLPEMSSLRSPPLNVVSTDVPLRHPLPLDICPQTSSFRGILSCPSSSQCPSV